MSAFLILVSASIVLGVVISLYQKLNEFSDGLGQLNKSISRLGIQFDRLSDNLTASNIANKKAAGLNADQNGASTQISASDVLPGFVPPAPEPRPEVPPVLPPIVPSEPALKEKPILFESFVPPALAADSATGVAPDSAAGTAPDSAAGISASEAVTSAVASAAAAAATSDRPVESEIFNAILEPTDYPIPDQPSSSPLAIEPMLQRLNEIHAYDKKRHEPGPEPTNPALEALRTGIDEESVDIFQRGWNWLVLGKEKLEAGDQIEYVAASNWLTRLGMIVLVLGLGFFIKYSIDQGWLVPKMRLLGTTVIGLLMYCIGLRLWHGVRNILGQALIAGGAAVLYFSAYASSEIFALIRPETSFACSIAITAMLVGSALRRRSELIGTLGFLGAYSTPFMFDIEPSSPYPLLSYLCLLGLGLAVIRRRQSWVIPVWIAYFGTWILFFCLYNQLMERPLDSGWNNPFAFVFCGLGAILFAELHFCAVGRLIHRERGLSLWEILLIVVNALFFYGVSVGFLLYFLPDGLQKTLSDRTYLSIDALSWIRAGFGVGMAAFFFLQSLFLGAGQGLSRRLWVVCTGLGFLLLGLAVPELLSPEWLIPSWLLELTAFLYIALRGESAFLSWPVRIVTLVLAFAATFIVAVASYWISPEVFLNKDMFCDSSLRAITSFDYGSKTGYWQTIPERLVRFLIPAFCLLIQSWISYRAWRAAVSIGVDGSVTAKPEYQNALESGWLTWSLGYAGVVGGIGGIALFDFLTFETNLGFGVFCNPMRLGAISVLWTLVALGLIIFGLWKNYKPIRIVGLIFFGIILWKIFAVDLSQLDQIYRIIAMVLLGLLTLFGGSLYLGRKS